VTRVSSSEFQVLVFLFLIMSARDDGKLYLRFMVLSGLRMKEGMESFNLTIELFEQNRLNEYFNEELSMLEHYRHKQFLRNTKARATTLGF
jgi:hypothetical protein